jgi:hypothetical protein
VTEKSFIGKASGPGDPDGGTGIRGDAFAGRGGSDAASVRV